MPSILLSTTVLLMTTTPVSCEQEEHPRVRLPMYRQHHSTSNGFGTVTTTEGKGTEWYAKLSLGTPAQNFTVLLDTGSEALWVAGTGCSDNDNPTCGNCPVYDSDKSSTHVKNGSGFKYTYGSGTVVGTLGQETVTLGPVGDGLIATNLTFAEVTQITGFTNLSPLFCGVLGLSFANMTAGVPGPSNVGHGAKTLVEVLAEQHPSIEPKFAFHLPRNPVPTFPFTPETGEFVVGKADPATFRGKLITAPVKPFQIFNLTLHEWSVEMTFTVDGVSGHGNTIIDSGSAAFAGLLPPVYEAVTRKTGLHPTCDEVVQKGPTMTVSVAGADFDITGADYAFGPRLRTCLGVSPQPFFALGNNFLRVVYTVFDVKQRKVSFAYATHSKKM